MPVTRPCVLIVTDKSDIAETHLILGLHRAGVNLGVACNPEGKYYQLLVTEGLVKAPLQLSDRFDKSGTKVIRRLVQQLEVDIVHCFNPRALAVSLRATRGLDVRVIAYRGVIGNVSYLNPESWITFLHPRLDRIVAVSDAVKKYFLALGFLGAKLDPAKVVRIYKGHSLDWYQDPPADLSEFNLPSDAFVICCTGRDRPGKGFATLIDAMEYIPDSCPIHLVLVGDLAGNTKLMRKVRSCRHMDRIHFAGYRTGAPQIAAACHALVLPSESEGLPRVVIEAMAHARPVIVTEAGGMPELVQDKVEGLVVPVKNPRALAHAFRWMEANRDQAAQMGRRGRERVETGFSSESTVRETIELYRDLTCGQHT